MAVHTRRKVSAPLLCKGKRRGAPDAVAHYAAVAVVEHETGFWGESHVRCVPEVCADGAGGVVVEKGVDGGEVLGG